MITIRVTATHSHTNTGEVFDQHVSESQHTTGSALDYARMCEALLPGETHREGTTLTKKLGNITITYVYEEFEG